VNRNDWGNLLMGAGIGILVWILFLEPYLSGTNFVLACYRSGPGPIPKPEREGGSVPDV
jgi:hypothetical protein